MVNLTIVGKLVPLGNSVAITITKKEAEKEGLKLNQEVEFVILRKNKKELLEKAFGIAKGAPPFERDEWE